MKKRHGLEPRSFRRGRSSQLDKLDRQIAKRIVKFLYERVARLEDPRLIIGEALRAPMLASFGNIGLAIIESWLA